MSRHLSAHDRTSRLKFDWRIIRTMRSDRYDFSAHRTAPDAENGRNPIETEADARLAVHYRWQFHISTLIGPGQYSPCTIIRVDISDPRYPFVHPTGWVVEQGDSRIPYSPHFTKGYPICNGSIWRNNGHITLGHYAVHLARLLNWDEQLGSAYGGYNPGAIKWWRQHLNRPIDPQLRYPALPLGELYGDPVVTKPDGGFRRIDLPPFPANPGWFRKIG